jgi:hypothetical protein
MSCWFCVRGQVTCWRRAIAYMSPVCLLYLLSHSTPFKACLLPPQNLPSPPFSLRPLPLPTPALQVLLDSSLTALPFASAQGLSNMSWALGRLGYAPPPEWIQAFLTAAYDRLPGMQQQVRACGPDQQIRQPLITRPQSCSLSTPQCTAPTQGRWWYHQQQQQLNTSRRW